MNNRFILRVIAVDKMNLSNRNYVDLQVYVARFGEKARFKFSRCPIRFIPDSFLKLKEYFFKFILFIYFSLFCKQKPFILILK